MPTPSEPIASEEGSRFGVDSCAPQFAAMRVGRIRLCALTKGHDPDRSTGSLHTPSISTVCGTGGEPRSLR